ncbi:unnamed protein product [Rodentolepis nana]|uniref:Major sperm protein n=1 Tax=Rodentolepis nana TaxID=102285 RepID=A0A158QJ93_RODNA|nr:unnamed protein product [Rodentolepis nana]
MDVTRFVFLVPSDEVSTSKFIWKVATPSMRIKDAIIEPFFDVTERKMYIQCVPKMDVPKYVTWNNCDSTKYTKYAKNTVKDSTLPPPPTLRKKKPAPPPPPVPIRRRLCRSASKESQLLHPDMSTNEHHLDQTFAKSMTEISDINSSESLNVTQELSGTISTINIHAMDEYQDEPSASERFFIPKSFIEPDKEVHDANSLSTECRTTPETSPAISINETIQHFDSFREDIPSVGATVENTATETNQNSGISPLLKTSTPTFAPFHVPNFEKEFLEMESSKPPEEDGSTANNFHESLQQAKSALKTVRQQKVTPVPLRNDAAEHGPSFLPNRDRANEKDWNGRFWCVDNRSRILSFMIDDERQC